MPKEIFYCWHCGKVEIPEPVGCCSGRDCGCMGLPIDPPFCSEKCQKEYYEKKQEHTKLISTYDEEDICPPTKQ